MTAPILLPPHVNLNHLRKYTGDNPNKSVIVYGPQGCGKTVNTEPLAKLFGVNVVFDDFQMHHCPSGVPRGVLCLTTMTQKQVTPYITKDCEIIGFDDAMRKINGTPSAQWRVDGEPDPHGKSYNCERGELSLGNLTDDELANAVFLHGDQVPPIQDVIDGKAKMPIVYLTAAKDRIRWLSRNNEELRAENEALKKQLADKGRNKLDAKEVEYPRGVFGQLILENSPYAFYLFQWVPYQTDAKQWRLKMSHDVKAFDGREEFGIWPNGSHCGSIKDDEVEFIRISREQYGYEWQDPRGKDQGAV
jgi:hypothetical protein